MWIKNNSDRSWEKYDCGKGVVIDIKPKSEFEVDEESAKVLLKNLGHEDWLVKIEEPTNIINK